MSHVVIMANPWSLYDKHSSSFFVSVGISLRAFPVRGVNRHCEKSLTARTQWRLSPRNIHWHIKCERMKIMGTVLDTKGVARKRGFGLRIKENYPCLKWTMKSLLVLLNFVERTIFFLQDPFLFLFPSHSKKKLRPLQLALLPLAVFTLSLPLETV